MLDLIVLGQLPGTEIRLGFIPVMILFEIGLIIYLVKRPPAETKKIIASVKSALGKKKNQLIKALSHVRHNVFSPKTKLVK